MKKRTTLLVIAVLVVANLLAIAGPIGAQDDAPTLLVWADDTRAAAIQEIGEGFAEEYGVAIEVQELPFGDIRDQFKVAAPAGEGPDIIIGAHDWLGELVVNGLLEPIDLGDAAGDFTDPAITAFTYEGELYGLPYATENVAFFYNPELVEAAPESWEDVRAISEALVEAGDAEYGYLLQEGDPYHFFGIQTAYGGYVFGLGDDGYDASDVGIDSDGAIEALGWLDAMVEDGLTPAGLDYDSMHALFESGDGAMMITGPWALGRIQESGVAYAIADIPGEGQPFLGAQGFMVSAFSEDALLASIFLTDFLATEDAMTAIFESGDRPSAYVSVLEGIDDEDVAAFGSAGANALPMPAIPEMSAVWTAWGDAVTLVFQQQVEADEAFTNAAEQVRAAIAGEE